MSQQAVWDMSGRTIVIVGCGRGMGVASALSLGQAGARIECLDIDATIADESVATLAENGIQATAHVVDVLDRDSVRDTLATVAAAEGKIDGVLNIVGRGPVRSIEDFSTEEFRTGLDINLTQQFIVAQASVPHLEATGGSYVSIASIMGLASSPDTIVYGAAKAGLISMIRTFALQFGPRGVRFNAIAPGDVDGPRARELGVTTGAAAAKRLARTPLRRFAEGSDIGSAALYLMSDMGRHVTGHVLVVDGGTMINPVLPTLQEHGSPPSED